jgi:hypothetical protein
MKANDDTNMLKKKKHIKFKKPEALKDNKPSKQILNMSFGPKKIDNKLYKAIPKVEQPL